MTSLSSEPRKNQNTLSNERDKYEGPQTLREETGANDTEHWMGEGEMTKASSKEELWENVKLGFHIVSCGVCKINLLISIPPLKSSDNFTFVSDAFLEKGAEEVSEGALREGKGSSKHLDYINFKRN